MHSDRKEEGKLAQTPLEHVVAHWNTLIENFQTSSTDFYAAVELALEARKIPGLKVSRVKWSEGGVLSPNREYLRVSGDRHCFDMCAAPFGTGFFFSSWMTKKKPGFVLLYFVAMALLSWPVAMFLGLIGAGCTRAMSSLNFGGAFSEAIFYVVAFFIVMWGVALLAKAGKSDPELAVLAMPVIGWVYANLFAQETYYRIDTMSMFRSAVHAAMMEAIDGQTTQKGLRGLTDDERKPVFHKFM